MKTHITCGIGMKHFASVAMIAMLSVATACAGTQNKLTGDNAALDSLKDSLESIVKEYPGEIGVALLTDGGDTLVVNNEDKYPLMSVFKLHQAISLCHLLEERDRSIDTLLNLNLKELNHNTWSPMLEEHSGEWLEISVRELLRYTLMQSDNNASNYLFQNIENVADADRFISTIIPRGSFRLSVTEAQMWSDHNLSYENHSSPLGAAILIERLFTDSLIAPADQEFLRTTLGECKTGDRIGAPLADKDSVRVAHKTGSGYRDEAGRLMAHNDVAFVQLPEGRYYALAVFVKDFAGTTKEAANAISRISSIIYDTLYKEPQTGKGRPA